MATVESLFEQLQGIFNEDIPNHEEALPIINASMPLLPTCDDTGCL
jgi:hypothetical protein